MSANDTFNIGNRVIDRIKSASTIHGLDVRKSAERFLCEELSRGFSAVAPVPHMVRGGCAWPQLTRESGDLDVVFARKVEENELVRSIRAMTPLLAKNGVVITKVGKAQELCIDGDGGLRVSIEAMVGKSCVITQLTATGGVRHLPAKQLGADGHPVQMQKTAGSVFFCDQQPLIAYYQPYEAQAADKLAAVVLRPDMVRWKDFDDLARLHRISLSPTKIALQLSHKLSYRCKTRDEVLEALPEVPSALSFEFAQEKARAWQMWQQRHGRDTSVDFIAVACDTRQLYHMVRERIIESLRPERRPRVRKNPTVEELRTQRIGIQRIVDKDKPVVRLSDYRREETYVYRPKF